MILYNITFFIEPAQENDFLALYQNTISQALIHHNYMSSPRLHKIRTQQGEDMVSYAVHLSCLSDDNLNLFLEQNHPMISNLIAKKFGQKVLMFGTPMELVNLD